MRSYLYTIIIPHKNIPELLQRCLDSIPKRSDVQTIIVDDNSNPDKVNFENFPGLGMPDTEVVFDKSGKGAGRARNIGLEHAKGQWILFADADDYYLTEKLDDLLNQDFEKYDVVAWLSIKIANGRREIYWDYGDIEKTSVLLYNMNEPWRKMVRNSLIRENKIRFQESLVSNDLLFSKKIAFFCKSFHWYNDTVYCWQIREGSLSHKYNGEKLIAALDVSLCVNKYLKGLNKTQFFDRTDFYMGLLWQESPVKFWAYLIIIIKELGYHNSKRIIKSACANMVSPNFLRQIIKVRRELMKMSISFAANRNNM